MKNKITVPIEIIIARHNQGKVKEINIPPEKTILDKVKTAAKKLFTSKRKFGGGAGAEEYVADKYGISTGIPLNPKYLKGEK